MEITVKFFAAAAATAGMDSCQVQVPDNASVADVLAQAVGDNAQLARLAEFCALLGPDGFIRDRSVPATVSPIEVLPPFAGG